MVFVVVGRRNHDEATSIAGTFKTAAPFLLALACGWVLSRSWVRPFAPNALVATWFVTVAGGLALRRLVFSDGIATPFIVVTTITLGVLIGIGRLAAKKLS